MKPVFQKLTSSPDEGVAFKVVRGTSFDCPWHFHSEYELILVLRSSGYRLVGDDLAALRPGDMVFVGPNLPHIYRNDADARGRVRPVHALLIQFEEGILGEALMRLPAMGCVRRLLLRSRRGLHVTGATRARVAGMMHEMEGLRGIGRFIRFLSIMEALAGSRECRVLASPGFVAEAASFDQERMNRVCQFIHDRLDRPIFMRDLARLVNLSDGAFSRFFRAHTGRTFPAFVNELRIGRACRLLAESEMTVTEVAFACGFANLSNFNRQFLRQKRATPRDYRGMLAGGALRS